MKSLKIGEVEVVLDPEAMSAYDLGGATRHAAATSGLIVRASGKDYVDTVPQREKLLKGAAWGELMSAVGRGKAKAKAPEAGSLATGTVVQWIKGGAPQWEASKPVKRISGDTAFFRGLDKGVPINELVKDVQASK